MIADVLTFTADIRAFDAQRRRLPRGSDERTTLWSKVQTMKKQLAQHREEVLAVRATADNRTCLECKHCVLDPGAQGYSDVTPSTPMSLSCCRDHYTYERDDITKQRLQAAILKARECEDFEVDGVRRFLECVE